MKENVQLLDMFMKRELVVDNVESWHIDELITKGQDGIRIRVGHADASADAHRMRINAHHPHIVQKMKSHFLPINCHFGLDSIAVSLFTNIREYS